MTRASADGWFLATQVSPGVTLLVEPAVHPFFRANCYRIAGRDFDIQLDFGVGVASLSAALPVSDQPVMAIATHAHVDHVGSFHEFVWRAGHAAEAQWFASMADEGTLASWFLRQPDPVASMPPAGFMRDRFALVPAPLTERLAEGSIVDTGSRRFTVLHLPGHSPGSIGLLDEVNGELFSGDAIYDDDLVDDIPGADRAVYARTMDRLAGLDVAVVHGGHGPSFGRQRMRDIARAYVASLSGR
jgi:glyoxylase-like metal-dependent hydrolase (beta-lactamase superfamily II)